MYFKIVSDISNVETIAKGRGIQQLAALRKKYGSGNWRKLKGVARVQLANGTIRLAEIHWYEAHGIGPKTTKSKGILTKNRGTPPLRFGSPRVKFAVCINTGDYVDLQPGRLYSVKSDKSAHSEGMLRIVDDSGEDYLYPIAWFAPVLVSRKATIALKKMTQVS